MWPSILTLGLVYLIVGKLSLQLAVVNAYTTAVWPPTGIALAALLLGGYRLWPGIFVGAFLVNLTTGAAFTGVGVLVALGMAIGNTLEALLGAWLVQRFAGGPRAFERATTTFAFAFLAGMLSTTVSASIGVGSLSLARLVGNARFADVWYTWWIGDATGDFLFAPLLILWVLDYRLHWSRQRAIEAAVVFPALCLAALSVYANLFPSIPTYMRLGVLCVAIVLWVAFRFGQREVAVAILALAAIAIWGALHGLYRTPLPVEHAVLQIEGFLGITSVTVLAVAAEVTQRRQHQRTLEQQAEALRKQAQLLDLSPVLVRDSQDRVTFWSTGMERLYGFTKREALGKNAHELLQTMFPVPYAEIQSHLARHGEWEGELGHKSRDGAARVVVSHWVHYNDEQGRPLAVLEANTDITGKKRVEEQIKAALKEKELLFQEVQRITELLPAGVYVCDFSGGIIRQFNQQAVKLWGREPQLGETEEQFCSQVRFYQNDVPICYEQSPLRLEPGKNAAEAEREMEIERPSGTRAAVVVSIVPLNNPQGQTVATIKLFHDITERRQREEALRAARDQLVAQVATEETLLAGAQQIGHLGSFRWDAVANRITWSDELYRIYGRSPGEFGGTFEEFLACVHPEDRAGTRALVERALRDRQPFAMRERIVRPNGEVRSLDSVGNVTLDADGRVTELFGICRDVTDELQADEALRASEAKFRGLLEQAPDAILILDQSGRIVLVNAQAETVFGYPREELQGKPIEMLVPLCLSDNHSFPGDDSDSAPRTRPTGPGLERSGRRRDGSEFPVEVSLSPLQTEAGILISSSIRDVTERKQAELELRQTEEGLRLAQEKLRALASDLVLEGEEIRRSIARELHDVCAQRLAAIGLRFSALARTIPPGSRALRREVRAIGREIETLLEEFRQIARGLHPSVLQELGLLAALDAECAAFSRTYNIDVQFSHDPKQAPLPADVSLSLYRIVQESLQNVAQHAGARQVRVELNGTDAAVHLKIRDDGCGFVPEQVKDKKGLGLISMDERARAVGGSFSIRSLPREGAEVAVMVPRRSVHEADSHPASG
jgi:PAS domain S-box-containing protein